MSSTDPRTSSTSTTNPGDRSAAEIERDVERTRARLTGTVEELKDRVSPGQMAEQAMDWLRSSGGRRFVDNIGATVRDNPMPVLLVAAGIGWLALSGRNDGRSDWTRTRRGIGDTGAVGAYPGGDYPEDYSAGYAGESYPTGTYTATGTVTGTTSGEHHRSLGERAGETAGGLRHRAEDLAGRAGETASGAWESATGAARSVTGGAASAGRGAARRAGDAWHAASDTAGDAAYRAARLGRHTSRSVAEAIESQPLLLGAVGFALGAALGGLLPSSEAEDRLMGERRDRMAGRLSSLAGEAYDKAREVAGEQAERAGEHLGGAYDRTRERVGGVSPQQGASALGEVARDLRHAVERTAQEAGDTAREAMGKPEGDTGSAAGTKPGTGTGGSTGTSTGTSAGSTRPTSGTPSTGSPTTPPARPGGTV
ncbi:MAG TPA: DUF3618 domain-containing protein [Falsiroseomonas sp.]|jgi:hypothetical protein|nr:DUF3618 domain-containing protein [Falsiroseomonas sp.]